MKNYNIPLTKEEIEKIYWISDKKETQKSLMSILVYCKKYTENGVLKYSVNKLHKMYVRYHKAITKSYFYTLVNKIKENFFKVVEETFEETFEEIEKPIESIENTSLEGDSQKPNKEYINNNTITNTLYTNPNGLICTEELVKIAYDLFKEYRIKSFAIKRMVISKLHTCSNINIQGAIAYVTKVIAEKKAIQESNRELYMNIVGNVTANRVKQGMYNYNKKKGKTREASEYSNILSKQIEAIENHNSNLDIDYDKLYADGIIF